MSRMECPREQDILDAAGSERWADATNDSLRAHVESCAICRDLVLVSRLYRDDHALAMEQVRIPSAGLVWWKSELRARREAVQTAARPIALAQGLAAACAVGALLGILSQAGIPGLSAFVMDQPLILWIALGVVILATPLALYFVLSD